MKEANQSNIILDIQSASICSDQFRIENRHNRSSRFLPFSNWKKRNIDQKEILKKINFSICHGDRVALLGRNGAGKTTLLKMMARIKYPTLGSITFGSQNVRPFLMGNHRIGFVSDGTVYENIVVNGVTKGIKLPLIKERADWVLEFAEMSNYRDIEAGALSAGQNMRVALAVSLLSDADIFLIDEWIGALDKYFFSKFNEALVKKLSASRAIVITSHNNQLLRRLCNRAIVLEAGEVVFDGELDKGIEKLETLLSKSSGNI